MRLRSAFANDSKLALLSLSCADKNKCLHLEQFMVKAIMAAGTFAMPGRNISVGLRWQK
ncbi:MAG: hypothetical protein MUP71_08075 [Candidatus Aminicenantes bacterium]|nr:hypothetical protein [Candidatus Aminicenantes bacterium]